MFLYSRRLILDHTPTFPIRYVEIYLRHIYLYYIVVLNSLYRSKTTTLLISVILKKKNCIVTHLHYVSLHAAYLCRVCTISTVSLRMCKKRNPLCKRLRDDFVMGRISGAIVMRHNRAPSRPLDIPKNNLSPRGETVADNRVSWTHP